MKRLRGKSGRLLECLTGSPAFPGSGLESAVTRLVRDPELPTSLPPDWATRSSYIRMLLIGLLLQVVLQKFRAGLIPEVSPPVRFEEKD